MTRGSGKYYAEWSWTMKALFLLICTAAGMAAATLPADAHRWYVHEPGMCILHWFSASLLAALLGFSLWTGVAKGRIDASWALLSWGSWISVACTLGFHVLCRDIGYKSDAVWWHVSGTILVLLIATGGFRAAWRAKWNDVSTWWLASMLPTIILYCAWQRF